MGERGRKGERGEHGVPGQTGVKVISSFQLAKVHIPFPVYVCIFFFFFLGSVVVETS